MTTWNSRGLRGAGLEELINRTNEKYLEKGLALIQKIPTPITPINIDQTSRRITLAYFDKKSTVDYMEAFEKKRGIAFFLIYYTHLDLFYYLPFDMLMFFWSRAKEGGRKSFRREELNPDYYLPKHNGILVPYLDILQKDLEDRDYT